MRRSSAGVAVAVGGAMLAGAVFAGVGGLGHAAPVASAAGRSASGTVATSPDQEGVTITATGQASGTPDELHVSLAAEVTRPQADAALTASSSAAARVAGALTAAGVASRDVRTSNLDVSADYDASGHITGWTARTWLEATLHDLPRAGAVLDAAIAAGGTSLRVDGLSYDLANPETVLAKARTQAFRRAEARARAYAAAAGRSLGPVMQVVEGGDRTVAPADGFRVPEAASSAGTSAGSFDPGALQPGTSDVSVTTTVRWSFA